MPGLGVATSGPDDEAAGVGDHAPDLGGQTQGPARKPARQNARLIVKLPNTGVSCCPSNSRVPW